MLTEILKYLFGGIGGSAIVAATVSVYRWDRRRCERERERKIRKRTDELKLKQEYKKARYAEASPKVNIITPTEFEYRSAIAESDLGQKDRNVVVSNTGSSYLDVSSVDSYSVSYHSYLLRRTRLLFYPSTHRWIKRSILKELLNRLAKELW